MTYSKAALVLAAAAGVTATSSPCQTTTPALRAPWSDPFGSTGSAVIPAGAHHTGIAECIGKDYQGSHCRKLNGGRPPSPARGQSSDDCEPKMQGAAIDMQLFTKRLEEELASSSVRGK